MRKLAGVVSALLVCTVAVVANHPFAQAGSPHCSQPRGWKPTDYFLKITLPRPGDALRMHSEAPLRPNLCNANLSGVDLSRADLRYADLSHADLSRANLDDALLLYANLEHADLGQASVHGANLSSANLSKSQLGFAQLLNGTNLNEANLKDASLSFAVLRGARMIHADLSGADASHGDMRDAQVSNANLSRADLTGTDASNADFGQANLNRATLINTDMSSANLSGADLSGTDLSGAKLANTRMNGADITGARYGPLSEAPNSYLIGIKGLLTVTIPPGNDVGIVQLQKALREAGLRDEERQATYVIEHSATLQQLASWQRPLAFIEGLFRLVFFEWTSAYGLYPGRALLLILIVGAVVTPIYLLSIMERLPTGIDQATGIYQVFPADRIDDSAESGPISYKDASVVRVRQPQFRKALPSAAYFSALSAFNIGFEAFNFGDWLRRAQPREYELRSIGWIRVVAGTQSLLSLYLFAIWVLTYFGRPFQ